MNEFWAASLNDPDYLETALFRVKQGKAPHLEAYWLNKINGKPIEQHQVSGTDGGPVRVVHEHQTVAG